MPAFFTTGTPLKLVDFNYEAYFKELEKRFGGLSFYSEWKRFWIDIFQEQDQQITNYIKKFPGSNPAMEIMKRPNVPFGFIYEMYTFEYITVGGSFYLHFDVEKMKYIQQKNIVSIPIEDIPLEEIYVDPTTPTVKNKLTDQRLPYLTRIYGVDKSFLCVDGNKRIQSKIKYSNVKNIKAYNFDRDQWQNMFFLDCDVYFMALTEELQFMNYLLKEKESEQEILKGTQMYLQSHD